MMVSVMTSSATSPLLTCNPSGKPNIASIVIAASTILLHFFFL
jgi:hypothetical protein